MPGFCYDFFLSSLLLPQNTHLCKGTQIYMGKEGGTFLSSPMLNSYNS